MKIVTVLCVAILSTSVIDPKEVVARSRKSTAATQQALVKQINQRARRLYKAFIKQSVGTTTTVDWELNDLLEDLLLAVDGLLDPRYTRHNLVVVMQIASDVEEELLWGDTSSDMILTWSRLHADLDRLAKMNGIKWSEAVITNELIAALAGDVETASRKVQNDLPQYQAISAKTSPDLPGLLSNFRNSAQELNQSPVDKLHPRIEALRTYARMINASLNNHVVSSALLREWRRITSRLEELVRLYSLDSTELGLRSFQQIADQN